jgi:hypothetical protein
MAASRQSRLDSSHIEVSLASSEAGRLSGRGDRRWGDVGAARSSRDVPPPGDGRGKPRARLRPTSEPCGRRVSHGRKDPGKLGILWLVACSLIVMLANVTFCMDRSGVKYSMAASAKLGGVAAPREPTLSVALTSYGCAMLIWSHRCNRARAGIPRWLRDVRR